MALILIPMEPSDVSARERGQNRSLVWAAVTDSPTAPRGVEVTVNPGARTLPLPDSGWRSVTAGGNLPSDRRTVWVQVFPLNDLPPASRWQVSAPGSNTATLWTLPDRLSSHPQETFNLLFGSCFYEPLDREGLAGRAAHFLPAPYEPHLKILCGDQVYLDVRGPGIPAGPMSSQRGAAFLKKYLESWNQSGNGLGFQRLLEQAGTYFTADDHEFWNDYPNRATLIPETWFASGRNAWRAAAQPLFDDFQTRHPSLSGRARIFTVPPLSFFIFDSRIHRQNGEREFCHPDDLQMFQDWVAGLEGPGVFCVGQPLFESPADRLRRNLADRLLPNFEQYRAMVRALFRAPHSLLCIAGDVHFGRIAGGILRNDLPRPVRLYEVIASPTSLVNTFVGGSSKPAPSLFPAFEFERRAAVHTLYHTPHDNFATLHFRLSGTAVQVKVVHWFPKRTLPAATERHEHVEELELI